MEDFEMRHALRRYVEAGEPPFSLTANTLITQARRRQRWRVGLGLGGGGAATTLAIVSAMALVPAGGGPTLGAGACDVGLPPGAWASPTVAFPTPRPPLPGGAPAVPQEAPPAVGSVEIVAVEQARVDEMSCFLKDRMLKLRPKASFAPHHAPPMEVVSADDKRGSSFEAGAYVIDGPLLCLVTVTVSLGDVGPAAGLTHADKLTVMRVKTKSSTIVVTVEGGAITDEQAKAIANAPEVDLYR